MEIGQEELKSVGFEAAMYCMVVERQLLFEESGNKTSGELECSLIYTQGIRFLQNLKTGGRINSRRETAKCHLE